MSDRDILDRRSCKGTEPSPRRLPGLTRRQALGAAIVLVGSAAVLLPERAMAVSASKNLGRLEDSRPEPGDPASSRAAGWGGHQNGRIPGSALARVPASVGQPYLRADAAAAYNALDAAFRTRFGGPLAITEAYRDLARQQALWEAYQHGGNLAAQPGTSVHGWALACDFGSGVASYGTPQKNWMDANAPRFGWQPRGNSFAQREAWHFEFDGTYHPGPGETDKGDDDVFKPRFVRVVDSGAPAGMNGLVAFFFPDRVVRTTTEAQINSLGRAWGVLKPGQKWSDVVDNLVWGEYLACENEINGSRTATRTEYVRAITAAIG